MSAHVYVDDKEAYQPGAAFLRGAWHVGVDYGGKLWKIKTRTDMRFLILACLAVLPVERQLRVQLRMPQTQREHGLKL